MVIDEHGQALSPLASRGRGEGIFVTSLFALLRLLAATWLRRRFGLGLDVAREHAGRRRDGDAGPQPPRLAQRLETARAGVLPQRVEQLGRCRRHRRRARIATCRTTSAVT